MTSFLAINLHRPIDDGCPTVALIDERLREEAQAIRWLTTVASDKPMKAVYDASLGRSRLDSLARWVWEKTHPNALNKPDFLGHVNHDLLDCRSDNLVVLRRANAGRTDKTRVIVQQVLEESGLTARRVRENAGFAAEGEPNRRGRPLPYTEEQAEELIRLRAENPEIPLVRFNAEVVSEVVGKRLGHRVLSDLLKP
jgi:hypothetical protein